LSRPYKAVISGYSTFKYDARVEKQKQSSRRMENFLVDRDFSIFGWNGYAWL